ncbi:hypothetical protein KP509_06G052600 [Ceratopteris richardii]|uniref:Uncharacterized protein n=1 Tax=Ceratopteris richardii TaxID=49495 RepID=A0A8T2UGE4_CERRI|nr:hypothetical protein KP509_06G052600 [Ceratopteris richardii]
MLLEAAMSELHRSEVDQPRRMLHISPSCTNVAVMKTASTNAERKESPRRIRSQTTPFPAARNATMSPCDRSGSENETDEQSAMLLERNGTGFGIEESDLSMSNPINATPRSSILYSPYAPSTYFFSPLSNTSFNRSQLNSPRISTDSNASNSSIKSYSSEDLSFSSVEDQKHSNFKVRDEDRDITPEISSLSIAPFPDITGPALEKEDKNSNDPYSFVVPEMEVLDEDVTCNPYAGNNNRQTMMTNFIKRRAPPMLRSWSASRMMCSEGLHRLSVQKKYYSDQLNDGKLAETGKENILAMQDTASMALDELFPLKRPKVAIIQHTGAAQNSNMAIENSKLIVTMERSPQEIVKEGLDEDGFAYSPVASAFLFSPRRASQKKSFMRSASTTVFQHKSDSFSKGFDVKGEPLQKIRVRQELNLGEAGGQVIGYEGYGSPKISSVLLRFAEAQERLYNSAPNSPRRLTSPTMCMPVCSLLERTLLCRTKLTVAATTSQFGD